MPKTKFEEHPRMHARTMFLCRICRLVCIGSSSLHFACASLPSAEVEALREIFQVAKLPWDEGNDPCALRQVRCHDNRTVSTLFFAQLNITSLPESIGTAEISGVADFEPQPVDWNTSFDLGVGIIRDAGFERKSADFTFRISGATAITQVPLLGLQQVGFFARFHWTSAISIESGLEEQQPHQTTWFDWTAGGTDWLSPAIKSTNSSAGVCWTVAAAVVSESQIQSVD